MTSTAQRQQIHQNYNAFQRALGSIPPQHRDEYALVRDRDIVDFSFCGRGISTGAALILTRSGDVAQVH